MNDSTKKKIMFTDYCEIKIRWDGISERHTNLGKRKIQNVNMYE